MVFTISTPHYLSACAETAIPLGTWGYDSQLPKRPEYVDNWQLRLTKKHKGDEQQQHVVLPLL